MSDMLTVREAAGKMGCAIGTVGNLIRAGKIAASKVGTHYRIPLAAIEDYLSGNAPKEPAAASPPANAADAEKIAELKSRGQIIQLERGIEEDKKAIAQAQRDAHRAAGEVEGWKDLIHAQASIEARLEAVARKEATLNDQQELVEALDIREEHLAFREETAGTKAADISKREKAVAKREKSVNAEVEKIETARPIALQADKYMALLTDLNLKQVYLAGTLTELANKRKLTGGDIAHLKDLSAQLKTLLEAIQREVPDGVQTAKKAG
ncbi:hypothetical protein LCGC14_0480850 [marine sediment metagenome]|uniref:Helix-turn-helix domain-containing protein n=1 Tax=marine sediment metagenome TaxID=412755 RepID=A0A0F9UWB3_9ZZZZ